MKEVVRSVGGFLTILTLLGLVAADVLVAGATLSLNQLQLLTALVGALLGVDIMLEKIPLEVDVSSSREDDDG